MMKQQILVITDDQVWQNFIPSALRPLDYQVMMVPNIAEGLDRVYITKPDLIILDTLVQGRNGKETCSYFRRVSDVPLMVLMRRACPDDPVVALNNGADAYLVKPVSEREFQARVKALLRRRPNPGKADQTKVYWNRDLMIDFHKRTVKVRGKPVHFSPTEYKLLTCLVQHRDRVLPHQFLLTQVWGSEAIDQTQYLGPYINSLRKKIEPDPSRSTFIKNRRGVGYRFACSTTH